MAATVTLPIHCRVRRLDLAKALAKAVIFTIGPFSPSFAISVANLALRLVVVEYKAGDGAWRAMDYRPEISL